MRGIVAYVISHVKNPSTLSETAMQTLIQARVEAIKQAHANNLIENMDMGADVLAGMLERAREPISNEEFTRREEALWRQRYQMPVAA